MSKKYHFSTAGSTNLQKVADAAALRGIVGVCNAAYTVYLKLYWFTPTAANASPTVGTTAPDLTFALNATGPAVPGTVADFAAAVNGQGQLWLAVTKLGTDADTTVVVANDATITVLYD